MRTHEYTPPGARHDLDRVAAAIPAHAARITPEERAALRPILWEDMMSEYDARFFSAHLRALPIELGAGFRALLRLWERDEERHYHGARRAYEVVFGLNEEERARIAARVADFGPLAHLFTDEFTIVCLGAYDELCTVHAYRANLPHYDRLGREFGALMRAVTADEAWHYGRFLQIAVEEHPHRLREAADVVGRIRASEGTPYANTFVLDHDDQVFDEVIYDKAQRALLSQIDRAARSFATGRRPRLQLARG